MNRTDFLKLMKGSGDDNPNILGELSSLIHTFPYFQSAHMLLLKGLQKNADVKFENQLKSSALKIANREVLYYYLKNEPFKLPDEQSEQRIPESVNKEIDDTDTQQVVIDIAKNSSEFITEIEKESGENSSEQKKEEYSIIITAESGDRESDASIIIVNEESGEIEEKIFYMDPGFSIPVKEDLLELDLEHDKITESGMTDVLKDEEQVTETLSDIQLQKELIDRFIINNPRIEPVKEKTDLPLVDISKPFVEEREEFLTETLARIYIKQGYYSKAIDIYERLSLKYPEKSSYFASLILEVKELINK